ncbi:MAG: amidohydrolase [Brevefilum sp.]|nr:amidohydrolase [Brevefilum sp.]MDT8381768.1 amidohydrolase [Brevefilum sp.]MDW7754885.1 amidohydrolase [Brevefilum sp.]
MTFEPAVLTIKDDLIAWRRHIHQYPELSFKEFETTQFIQKKLKTFGHMIIDRPTRTGLIARVRGRKPGIPRTIAIRADIDALPIQENNNLPFISKNSNVMHACGHDGHTAILLALAKLLIQDPCCICGEVRLIFQHAEELPPGGAIELLEAGSVKGVEAVLGLHLSSNFDTGIFGVKQDVLTAAVDRFDITLSGKGGHCAYPEQSLDPVPAMAELILALQTVVSRKIAPQDPVVVSVCMARTGTAYNIIPDDAAITASVRSFNPETRKQIEREVRQIASGIALSYGLEAVIDYEYGYPSVINDPGLTQLAEKTLVRRFGENQVMHIDSLMPGEDFSYFLHDCKGFFVELGSRNTAKGTDQPHHNSKYQLDEDALLYGVQYFLDMVRVMLNGVS